MLVLVLVLLLYELYELYELYDRLYFSQLQAVRGMQPHGDNHTATLAALCSTRIRITIQMNERYRRGLIVSIYSVDHRSRIEQAIVMGPTARGISSHATLTSGTI